MKFRVRICLLLFLLVACLSSHVTASEKWAGVDESVVEKYAKEQGREPRDPIINTDQGDLLLFVFLMAGAVGGFAAGYYWRVLVTEKPRFAGGEQQKASQG
ncbi:MAG: cobalt transporter [Nitrospirota bacterium]|nr:cobalt transporter [Nitrospirota bacterium]